MKTIKTDTHLLLVDETAERKKGDWVIGYSGKEFNMIAKVSEPKNLDRDDCKIIAASPKLGDLPEFETLPPNTEDVEKLAKEWTKSRGYSNTSNDDKHLWSREQASFIAGYKQAKSETMFSLEDMKTAMFYSYNTGRRFELKAVDIDFTFDTYRENYIQSLTKPKEYEFVPEMECGRLEQCECPTNNDCLKSQPKIVNNKIQGTWKQKKK